MVIFMSMRNDFQINDTQHIGLICDTQYNSIECHLAERQLFCYSECHYAECRHAECHRAVYYYVPTFVKTWFFIDFSGYETDT
jgi:hypothetical protein